MEELRNTGDQFEVYTRDSKLHRNFPPNNEGYRSTVLIKRINDNKIHFGCGCLAAFDINSRPVHALITCYHVIPTDTIKPDETIELIQQRPPTGETVRFSLDIKKYFGYTIPIDILIILLDKFTVGELNDNGFNFADNFYENANYNGAIFMWTYFESQQLLCGAGNASTISESEWQLKISEGKVEEISAKTYRSNHSASTAEGCSGSALFTTEGNLLGFHMGGNEQEKINRFVSIVIIKQLIEELFQIEPRADKLKQELNMRQMKTMNWNMQRLADFALKEDLDYEILKAVSDDVEIRQMICSTMNTAEVLIYLNTCRIITEDYATALENQLRHGDLLPKAGRLKLLTDIARTDCGVKQFMNALQEANNKPIVRKIQNFVKQRWSHAVL